MYFRDRHNRDRKKRSGQAMSVQYLIEMSHGKNLSSTSGESEFSLRSNSLQFMGEISVCGSSEIHVTLNWLVLFQGILAYF